MSVLLHCQQPRRLAASDAVAGPDPSPSARTSNNSWRFCPISRPSTPSLASYSAPTPLHHWVDWALYVVLVFFLFSHLPQRLPVFRVEFRIVYDLVPDRNRKYVQNGGVCNCVGRFCVWNRRRPMMHRSTSPQGVAMWPAVPRNVQTVSDDYFNTANQIYYCFIVIATK